MHETSDPGRQKKLLGRGAFALFVIAILMGPGPGILLINPDSSRPDPAAFALGMPVIYLWASFWFAMEAVAVIVAYWFIWRKNDR